MSFDDTGREPEQAFRLNRDPLAELEYPTKWEQEQFSLSPQRFPSASFLQDVVEFERAASGTDHALKRSVA